MIVNSGILLIRVRISENFKFDNILDKPMKNNVNDKPSANKEDPKINPSEQEITGSEAPLTESVTTPRKRKVFGFGKSKTKAKEKQLDATATDVKQVDAKQADAKKSKSTKKGKKSSSSTTALKVILAILLLSFIALAGFALYLFMPASSTKDDTPVIIDTNSSVVKPQDEQVAAVEPLEQQADMANQMQPAIEGEQPVQMDASKTDVSTDKTATDVNKNVATVDQAGSALPTPTVSSQDANDKTKATVAEASQPKPASQPLNMNVPDAEKIINAEVPQDESLVKEELDKLADEEQRLEQQEKLLEKRLKMMDELTEKKEEQIKLLEKQIAQLEKSESGK